MNYLDINIMDEVTWSYIVFVLASLPWVSYAFMIMFFCLSLLYGKMKMYRVASRDIIESDGLPGVSILKPLMGVDPFLEKNLESHFNLAYPKFEVLICVADEQDPALDVVRRIQQRYPNVDCRLFTGGRDGILNPLVHNLTPAYESAKYDIVWISTSRIKASTEIMHDMVARMNNNKVGLVHQLPFTTDQTGFAAAIEKVYFGASVTKFYLAFHVLGISCFTGMSYLIKKTHLEEVKGISYFGRFLAEDFFLAKYLHNRGLKHQVSAIPAQQNVASTSVAAYKDRMVRWLRLRLNMMPITAGFLEPMCESLPLGIYASWSAYHLLGISPYLWFAGHWGVWFMLDFIQLQRIQDGPLPFSFVTFAGAWVVRELLYVLVYCEALCNVQRITWGRRTYRLSNFGESLKIDSERTGIKSNGMLLSV